MKNLRELSIFERILAVLSVSGLVIALISGAAHYHYAERMIKTSVHGQMDMALEASVAYFERTYTTPVRGALRLIESSPAVNALLSSSGDELYMTRPAAERLILAVSNGNPELYSWIRMIDAAGMERIIVEGNRRVRAYRSVLSAHEDQEHQAIYTLYQRLSLMRPGAIAFAGPHPTADGGYSMLVGIAKHEPEIGGFGGAVMTRIDLQDYLQYLANYEVLGETMAWVFDRQGQVLLRPPAGPTALDPRAYLERSAALPDGAHVVTSAAGDESRTAGLLKIALVMSPQTFHAQLLGAAGLTAGIVAGMIILSTLLAYLLARQIAIPVRVLVEAAQSVAAGNLDARVNGQWSGEFSSLAATFNRMTERLGETTVSKAYIDDIMHSMSEALVVLDGQGRMQTVNRALCDLLGYETEALLGQPLVFILDDPRVQSVLETAISTCSTLRGVETLYKTRTGELIPVALSVSPMNSRSSCCSGTVCVARDIRRRKQVEQENARRQRRSETQQQAILRLATDTSLARGDVAATARLATRLCAQATETSRVGVWVLNHEGSELHCEDLYDATTDSHINGHRLRADEYPRYFGALQIGRAIAADDVLEDPRTSEFARSYLEPLGIRSMLDAAVRVGGRLAGVVCIEQVGEPRQWSHEDIAFASEVADQIAQALTNRARTQMEEELRTSETRFRALYEDNPAMMFILDVQGRVVSVNRSAAKQLDYPLEELIGKPLFGFHNGGDQAFFRGQIRAAFNKDSSVRRWEAGLLDRDGETIWVRETARLIHNANGERQVLLVCEDMTEVRQLSQRLVYQASHDALTGLLNRREFEDRLQRVLETASESGTVHALCFIDLDQFKVINDTCGHIAGDELLRQIGLLLGRRFRGRDSVARLGGDEFGVLMEHCKLDQAERTANAVREAIEDFQFAWDGRTFGLGCSIGLVEINAECAGITELMSAADTACYAAKDQGRNRVHVYSEEDEALARRRNEMQWVARIRDALAADRFQLCCQAIVPIAHQERGLHYEILVRLIDENGDIVPPGAFLPAAERYNLAPKVDRWVIAGTLRWLAAHPHHLAELEMCSINVSGNSFSDEGFVEFVLGAFQTSGVSPEKVCFELTETAAISDILNATRFIDSLKQAGCRFALDDFGSGVSSFGYLKSLAVDFIKIDGMFVKDIVIDPIDRSIVRSINEVAHELGKETIAEYVEDAEILALLHSMGVGYAQGYGVGRPLPLDEFEAIRQQDPVRLVKDRTG